MLDLLASDVSEAEILEDYPHLTKDDIQACLTYGARSCKDDSNLDRAEELSECEIADGQFAS